MRPVATREQRAASAAAMQGDTTHLTAPLPMHDGPPAMAAGVVAGALFAGALLAGIAAATAQETHALPAEDRPIEGSVEDLFVIGVESGEDHEMLYGLVDVVFAPDGELYVLEERNRRISVYGSDGTLRRQFGRRGQGPGEFQRPTSLALTAGGELVVWDYINEAYLLFAPTGEYRRHVRWTGEAPDRDSLRAWPSGGVAYLPLLLHEDTDPPADVDRGAILHDPLGVEGGPRALHSVHQPRRRTVEIGDVLLLNSGPAFAPSAYWDVLSDGRLAVVDGVEYRVRLVRPDASPTALVRRDIAPRPTSGADRERERDRVREAHESTAGAGVSDDAAGGGGGTSARRPPMSERVRRIVDAVVFADLIPVVRDLRVDAGDRLWIQRRGATYFDDGPIDVVSASGDYVGTLPPMRMPDAFGPEGMVAWMERGREVAVERVIVRRLPPALR